VSRVPLITAPDAPLTARAQFAGGDPGSLVASLAHVPEVLEVALPFVGRVLGSSAIGARTKEIVILRTSAVQRCTFCVRTHTVVALDTGLSRAEVEALRSPGDATTAFEHPAERALLAWTDVVALGPGPVDNVLAEGLRAHYTDAEMVELTLLVATTVMLNRYCTALELPAAASKVERLREEGLL
jgi:AhpD family alkylhydroperoxidase